MSWRALDRIRIAAVLGPVAVAALAALLRAVLASTGAALVLVLVVVAVGAAGDRPAGVLAALSSALSFDFFLTVPYERFAILGREDVETAVLLLAIGLAVTEISLWGRRHQARSRRIERYLGDVARVATMAADGTPHDVLATTVEHLIGEVLDLDAVRYETAGDDLDRPVLARDGSVVWRGDVLDVARHGLPTMDVVELPAGEGVTDGRFLLTASTTLRRPSLDRLLVAVTLAEQVRVRAHEA